MQYRRSPFREAFRNTALRVFIGFFIPMRKLPFECPLRLQLLKIVLAELRHLRLDDYTAVGLIAVISEILLMIIFSRIKHGQRRNLRDDRIVPQMLFVQFSDGLLGNRLLLRRVIEDRRAILRASIIALTV